MKNQANSELDPCPFCGKELYITGHNGKFIVGCSHPACPIQWRTEACATREMAVAMANTRAQEE